jgi:hypothetical protein
MWTALQQQVVVLLRNLRELDRQSHHLPQQVHCSLQREHHLSLRRPKAVQQVLHLHLPPEDYQLRVWRVVFLAAVAAQAMVAAHHLV